MMKKIPDVKSLLLAVFVLNASTPRKDGSGIEESSDEGRELILEIMQATYQT